MQSKKHSLYESVTNTLTGLIIAVTISQLFHMFQHYLWPGFKWDINLESNLFVTVVLTIVSVIRGYIVRRAFNRRVTNDYSEV